MSRTWKDRPYRVKEAEAHKHIDLYPQTSGERHLPPLKVYFWAHEQAQIAEFRESHPDWVETELEGYPLLSDGHKLIEIYRDREEAEKELRVEKKRGLDEDWLAFLTCSELNEFAPVKVGGFNVFLKFTSPPQVIPAVEVMVGATPSDFRTCPEGRYCDWCSDNRTYSYRRVEPLEDEREIAQAFNAGLGFNEE